MVVVVGSYMCLSKAYGFIQKIEVFPAFARATKRDRWCRSASMSVSNAWHRREFKIAPSILSADLARLGEEVSGSAFIVFLYWSLLLKSGLVLSLEVDKRKDGRSSRSTGGCLGKGLCYRCNLYVRIPLAGVLL